MKKLIFLLFLLAPLAHAQSVPTLDLLWSADTYKPPFYQGHTLATPNSTVKVRAIISGTS